MFISVPIFILNSRIKFPISMSSGFKYKNWSIKIAYKETGIVRVAILGLLCAETYRDNEALGTICIVDNNEAMCWWWIV